jgi:hypothetical protein
MARMKQLLEGDVVRLMHKIEPGETDYHLGQMKHHSKMASHYASLSAHHSGVQEMDHDLKDLHAQLASSHSASSLLHGAIKNQHFKMYKQAKKDEEAKALNRHTHAGTQDTSQLPKNAVRLRGK